MVSDRVTTYTNDLYPFILQRLHIIAKPTGLLRASTRHVSGIEIDHDNMFSQMIGRLPVFA